MSNEPKKITLPLSEYLDDLLTYKDKVVVNYNKGNLIKNLDAEENFVHVELHESENIATVWRIKDWRDSYTRYLRQKAESERNRQQYWLDEDNIKVVSKALAKTTGIKNPELLKPLAIEIIKNKKFEVLPHLNLADLKVRVE